MLKPERSEGFLLSIIKDGIEKYFVLASDLAISLFYYL
jgi:hypothetical protein